MLVFVNKRSYNLQEADAQYEVIVDSRTARQVASQKGHRDSFICGKWETTVAHHTSGPLGRNFVFVISVNQSLWVLRLGTLKWRLFYASPDLGSMRIRTPSARDTPRPRQLRLTVLLAQTSKKGPSQEKGPSAPALVAILDSLWAVWWCKSRPMSQKGSTCMQQDCFPSSDVTRPWIGQLAPCKPTVSPFGSDNCLK